MCKSVNCLAVNTQDSVHCTLYTVLNELIWYSTVQYNKIVQMQVQPHFWHYMLGPTLVASKTKIPVQDLCSGQQVLAPCSSTVTCPRYVSLSTVTSCCLLRSVAHWPDCSTYKTDALRTKEFCIQRPYNVELTSRHCSWLVNCHCFLQATKNWTVPPSLQTHYGASWWHGHKIACRQQELLLLPLLLLLLQWWYWWWITYSHALVLITLSVRLYRSLG